MTIPELRQKFKQSVNSIQSREVYTILLIMLVGLSSFGLGRLSKLQEARVPISIHAAAAAAAAAAAPLVNSEKSKVTSLPDVQQPLAQGGKIVGSKKGTKYHFPWCSGAQHISEANKIWFNSVEEARKAGYTPASNCKGLK